MKKKVWTVSYSCWESGCSGHVEYYWTKKEAMRNKKLHSEAELSSIFVNLLLQMRVYKRGSRGENTQEVCVEGIKHWNLRVPQKLLKNILFK